MGVPRKRREDPLELLAKMRGCKTLLSRMDDESVKTDMMVYYKGPFEKLKKLRRIEASGIEPAFAFRFTDLEET